MSRTVITLAELPSWVGVPLGPTAWRRLSQSDIDVFADLTGDHQWIHVDRDAAARSPFGSTIAHGYLTLALAGGFWSELFDVSDASVKINAGLDRVRWLTPVPPASDLRMRAEITAASAVARGYRLEIAQTIELRGAERPAAVVEFIAEFRGEASTAGGGHRGERTE